MSISNLARRWAASLVAFALPALSPLAAADELIIKWQQPPDDAGPGAVFYGWDELSQFGGPQIVADDWVCTSDDPVTHIRWWGSFLGWTKSEPPLLPTTFEFAIWTDVPAGQPDPFSHPGTVIWQASTPIYGWFFYGWEFDPRTGSYRAVFQFDAVLDEPLWFYQPSSDEILWLSIAANYAGQEPQFPWGWMTRPRNYSSPAPDDAVIIFNPLAPAPGDLYQFGVPITWPTSDVSWDMAFELISEKPVGSSKWEQEPNPELPGIHAHENMMLPGTVLADNWLCEGGDVWDLHWFGNYQLDPGGMEMRNSGVAVFKLSIHANLPMMPWCLPGPPLWEFVVPFPEVKETPTGLINIEGSMIYEYSYDLPGPFPQTPGEIYWFNIIALSHDPFYPAMWRWQEAARGFSPILCPAAAQEFPMSSPWYTYYWPDQSLSDLAFKITSVVEIEPVIKWSQLPGPYEATDVFNGWNEYSVSGSPQIVADDWFCATDDALTDIEWWGSFIGWSESVPPQLPMGFDLAIWTDVPAGADEAFSHPGVVQWAQTLDNYTWEFAGWDFDPRDPMTAPEACFKFSVSLSPDQVFEQGPEPSIYWLSIAAAYDNLPVDHPWGWKTRPHDPSTLAPDDAVQVFDPTAPAVGSVYLAGQPIWWPVPEQSWDACFNLYATKPPPPVVHPKWTQLPHESGEGFDAVSDLWWATEEPEGVKELQLPGHELTGLHDVMPTVIADDWLCDGRPITDLHWWGNYELDDFGHEKRGAGILAFHLSIHGDAGGKPMEPPLWQADVPFADAEETVLTTSNGEGAPLYLYGFDLPTPFEQKEGLIYWLDISVIPVDLAAPPMWRWQEHARVPIELVNLSPAMSRTESHDWLPIVWDVGDPPLYSEMAFMVTVVGEAFESVNRTVADDFVSDGRPIHAVRWWGSYWDEAFIPIGLPGTVNPVDGWFITFHWAEESVDPACPPDHDAGVNPTALGTYFAPADAVEITPTDAWDCYGHPLFEYMVYLSDCCLLCQEFDPRVPSPEPPAIPSGFFEQPFTRYWLSVQAVTGVMWLPPECPSIFTGKLPSLLPTTDGHFWGWHSSPADTMNAGPLEEACAGAIVDFAALPPECWGYGGWEKEDWGCDPIPPTARTDLAFELLTEIPACEGDANLDGTIDPLDAGFVMARFGCTVGAGSAECDSADQNRDGLVDPLDVGFVLARFGPCE